MSKLEEVKVMKEDNNSIDEEKPEMLSDVVENVNRDNIGDDNRFSEHVPDNNTANEQQNVESCIQTNEEALYEELQNLENISSELETFENGSEDVSTDFESVNSGITFITPQSIKKEIISNQLIVLEPNNPIMVRFQNTLKQHLLKQKENIKQELLSLDGVIRSKQNEKFSLINDLNNLASRVETQHNLLSEFHRMKSELEKTNKLVETSIQQGKQRFTEILTKTSIETKKFSEIKRQLDCSRGLLKELKKYEKEQEIIFNMCNQKKSQTKQYKKKLLNDQQKQDLLLLSLTQEILRLEDRMKQLGEQAETKYNERELLKQKVMDSSTDLDAINGDNTKITLLWNDVLINIQQRDKSFQKIKNDKQEAQSKYHILLMEANSYKRSAHNEFLKNDDLRKLLKKLRGELSNLQNNFKTCLDKFNYLKDELSKLIQITEFQQQNLNQVFIEQKSMKNEINALLHFIDKKTNQKLRYEEDILDELKKQLLSNNYCVQINNKISELKVQNKDHEFVLVGVENNLTKALLKLEQYRTTSLNLEKDIEENTKRMNNQGFALSTLDSELKKLEIDIQNKSRQIDLESKQLETLKKKCEDGYIMTPQMQIDQVRLTIEEVGKENYFIKQTWVQKQNKNMQLLDQRNKQLNELNKGRKNLLSMVKKNIKLENEIDSLSKEVDQYKRTLTNMRNTILKLNENFNHNKGKSSQLLNENEWIQWSYLAELKENEKQCLEYMDRLKSLKNELNELKNMYIEKQRESKSWDTKIQLLVEIKKEMKNKNGDLGDIDAMKNEIHRMQIRESQLKKILEKIMLDLEVCISRREMIYNKVAAKDIRLKGKNEAKQKFLKKLDNLRINIKKISIECKKLDRNINDLQHNKMELENKLAYLSDQLVQVQKNVNELVRNIEDIGITKIKNIHNLSYKQNHAKYLDEVKKGKYRLLIKNESKMNEEFAAEWKKNSDLINVVEALKNDFPYLDFQITRLLNMLKSIDN